jgi:uncharacterized membrane protein
MAIQSKTIISGATASDINNAGEITGSYYDPVSGMNEGYIYRHGSISLIKVPDAGHVFPRHINSSGVVIGGYAPTGSDSISYSFLYDHGRITKIKPDGATGSELDAINDAGQAAGIYYDGTATHVFLLDHRTIIPLDVPTQALGVQILGIDNAGGVIGRYADPDPSYTELPTGEYCKPLI